MFLFFFIIKNNKFCMRNNLRGHVLAIYVFGISIKDLIKIVYIIYDSSYIYFVVLMESWF